MIENECIVSGNQDPPWDCEESIPMTGAWETVMWQGDLFGRKYALGLPMTHLLPSHHEKVQPCLQQGQNKCQCPEFLFHIKA